MVADGVQRMLTASGSPPLAAPSAATASGDGSGCMRAAEPTEGELVAMAVIAAVRSVNRRHAHTVGHYCERKLWALLVEMHAKGYGTTVSNVMVCLGCYSEDMEQALRLLLQGLAMEGLIGMAGCDVLYLVPPHERVERRDAMYSAVAAAYMAADDELGMVLREVALAYVTSAGSC